jgi:hypothetical protein
MIETLFIILAVGALCIGCFLVGAKVGQKVTKGEEIELPTINPLEAYRKHEAKRKAEEEQEKIDTIMQNIECYDGTSKGQKDV